MEICRELADTASSQDNRQDKTAPVFVIATANDVKAMPPELLRKGRFDEIFFVALPHKEERKEIFNIHLRKRNRNPELFDLDMLAEQAEGFSGAEIEQAILDAMYESFGNKEDISTDAVMRALQVTRPLSCTMKEKLDADRDWAKTRARFASSHEERKVKNETHSVVSAPLVPQQRKIRIVD